MQSFIAKQFAKQGLDLLKRSVLLVLYEERNEMTYPKPFASLLLEEDIYEKLQIPQPLTPGNAYNALIHGILQHLLGDLHAEYISGEGWQITEAGVRFIEGKVC